jgi:16S rRNA (guanine1207-N2)-methyltransferase
MEEIIEQKIHGFTIKLKTKPGVFSAKGIDSGTRLLIDCMKPVDEGVIADLGAGSGILGFVIAKMSPKAHVHLLEDHMRSFSLLEENVELNQLKNVEIFLSDLFLAVSSRTYNQIFSNPPQQLGNQFLEEVIDECFNHLKNDGELWLVIKRNLKEPLKRMLEKSFAEIEIVETNKEYLVFKAIK